MRLALPIFSIEPCCRFATKTAVRCALMVAPVCVNWGVRNAYHRLLGGLFSLRGAGRLLLPSQPSGRYRNSSALKVSGESSVLEVFLIRRIPFQVMLPPQACASGFSGVLWRVTLAQDGLSGQSWYG